MMFDGVTVGEKLQREGEGGLIGLLCSRNARPQKALVGRAQWETDSVLPPGGGCEQAWMEYYLEAARSTCAGTCQ